MCQKILLSVLFSFTAAVCSPGSGLSVLIIGDSNTEHGFISLALADTVRSYYGGSSGTGYIPFDAAFYELRYQRVPRFSMEYPDTWKVIDMFEGSRLQEKPYLSPNGQWLKSASVGATAMVTFPGNGVEVYWLAQPTGGDFSIRIGSTYQCTVSTAGPTSVHKTSVTGLTGSSQFMQCSVTSLPEAQSSVVLLGVDARSDSSESTGGRSVVHNWGNGWSATSDFLAIDSLVFQTGLRELAPDIVVVLLGTNDHLQDSRSAADLKVNLKAILNRIKAAGFSGKIMLVSTFMTDNESGRTFVPQYRATAWPEAAAETGVPYWDMSTWYGNWDPRYMMDGNHCNATGGRKIAVEMFRQILAAFPATGISRKANDVRPAVAMQGQPWYTQGRIILPGQQGMPQSVELFSPDGSCKEIVLPGKPVSTGISYTVPRLGRGVYSLRARWKDRSVRTWLVTVLSQ